MPSLRVYFITHHNGCLTGLLMRTWRFFFDASPPSAYGRTEGEVLNLLQQSLEERLAANKDTLDRYFWDEDFEARRINIHINPQTTINKRTVIGKKEVPLQLTYLCSKLEGGGFRVLLPRFEWSLIVEDLSIAEPALRQAVSSALLGEKAKWLFDFRHEGTEFVREWAPSITSSRPAHDEDSADKARLPTIHEVCDDWVLRAARRRLPFVVGAIPMDGAKAWVTRATPQSLLIVGPGGVGKTAWVRRLAYQLNQWRRVEPDKPTPRLWATSADRIIAGQIYLGMWQKRCIKLLDELSFEGDYLYVDHIMQIFREQPGGSSIADILIPGLQGGQLSLIGECTPLEFELFQRKTPDLVSLFHVVRLEAPTATQMPLLLQAYQARRNAGTKLSGDALMRLVRHLEHFQRHVSFPGKGFMFLDWLHKTSGGAPLVEDRGLEESPAAAAPQKTLYPNEISEAFSQYSGLPVELISDAHAADAAHIGKRLKAKVIGQDLACFAAGEVLARFKAGLNDPERPCGSLLFVGPTGVGKTELAKQIAAYMFGSPERMIRLDMSEYMGFGSAQRLLTPSRGQSLVERMRQQPLSLVLLDEIEKAHPEVFDVLLGVLGEGRLTDIDGQLADFRMSLMILTSNLGVQETPPPRFGVEEGERPSQDRFTRAVRQHFRPEFFNRLDRVISFRNLTPGDVAEIVDLDIASLHERAGFKRRKVRVSVSDHVRGWLAGCGYHPTRGARPLKRLIESSVMSPLAVLLSERPQLSGCTVHVASEDEAVRGVARAGVELLLIPTPAHMQAV